MRRSGHSPTLSGLSGGGSGDMTELRITTPPPRPASAPFAAAFAAGAASGGAGGGTGGSGSAPGPRPRFFFMRLSPGRAIVLGIAVSAMLLYVYHLTLVRWGTFSLPMILWYTAPYEGPVAAAAAAGDALIGGQRPRVVVSLTTLPHHLEDLQPTIDSLLAQRPPVDAVYVNIPDGRNPRTNQSYYVPKYLEGIDRVEVLRGKDFGPLTKLMPALLHEKDPNTIVITVDDDKTYDPDALQILVESSVADRRVAFGMCGWSFMWYFDPVGVVPVYAPLGFLRGHNGRYVDVLQACCGNAYRRGHFRDLDILQEPPKECFTTDDLWVAAYLALHSGVRRVIVPDLIMPSEPEWKRKRGAKTAFSLSDYNSANKQDIHCIRAAERVFGREWPATVNYGSDDTELVQREPQHRHLGRGDGDE